MRVYIQNRDAGVFPSSQIVTDTSRISVIKHGATVSYRSGSVMLVALILSAILGVALAGYLVMVGQNNAAVSRSQSWNTSMVMAEAGIEEALQLLNKYNSKFEAVTNWAKNSSISEDNWTALSSDTYYLKRSVG